jgi:hypothetical protein
VDQQAAFPLWLKIAVTLFYVYISRGMWQQYSAFNFLWFSHIGLMGTVLALWFESRLLASMMLLNTFVADGVGWTLGSAGGFGERPTSVWRHGVYV